MHFVQQLVVIASKEHISVSNEMLNSIHSLIFQSILAIPTGTINIVSICCMPSSNYNNVMCANVM